MPGRDARLYLKYRGIDLTLGIDIHKEDCLPTPTYNFTEQQTENMTKDVLLTYRSSVPQDVHEARIWKELNYFDKENMLSFIWSAAQLIKKFKQDGIVWSSRGSGCASYVLYLLEIHDVNPILYGIDFSEFSKEAD